MARLWTDGAELNSTAAAVEVTSTSSAAVTSSTAHVRSGSRAWRVNPAAGTATFDVTINSADAARIGYLRFYLYIATMPGATVNIGTFRSGTAAAAVVRLTSAGKLQLATGTASPVQVGSDSATLNTGQWYRVELKCDATTSPGALELRLDGAVVASGANSVQGQWQVIRIGSGNTASTCDLYFDDIAVNDDTGSSQNNYPGRGKVIVLSPSAAGDSNMWTKNGLVTAGDANSYTLVDELPPNDATDYVSSKTLNDSDLYNFGDSGIGNADVVTVVEVSARYANNTADATTAVAAQIEKKASGTKTVGTGRVPNSTTYRTNGSPVLTPMLITYADPDGAAWSKATLDSLQAGVKITAVGTNAIRCSAVWVTVEYLPRGRIVAVS